jgi:predicted site-specific integrase-resolvase
MPSNDLIGSLEAALILGVNRATFNKWCAAGDVPIRVTAPSKVGARLFRREDIEALVKQRDLAACMARHPAGSDLTA